MAEGVRVIAIEGIRSRDPLLTDQEVVLEFIRLLHGDLIAEQIRTHLAGHS